MVTASILGFYNTKDRKIITLSVFVISESVFTTIINYIMKPIIMEKGRERVKERGTKKEREREMIKIEIEQK